MVMQGISIVSDKVGTPCGQALGPPLVEGSPCPGVKAALDWTKCAHLHAFYRGEALPNVSRSSAWLWRSVVVLTWAVPDGISKILVGCLKPWQSRARRRPKLTLKILAGCLKPWLSRASRRPKLTLKILAGRLKPWTSRARRRPGLNTMTSTDRR